MKLRKAPRTRRVAKAARERKRELDGAWGLWTTVGDTKFTFAVGDGMINAGDVITISGDTGSARSIKWGDIPKLKNPKRVHPARKRKAEQLKKPIKELQWITVGGGQMQVQKISQTEWKIIGTGCS